jgi:hypothetical protein
LRLLELFPSTIRQIFSSGILALCSQLVY